LTAYARKPATFGDDIAIAKLERARSSLGMSPELSVTIMPQSEGAVENRVEVCICDTVAEDQTTKRLYEAVRIVEMDVPSC